MTAQAQSERRPRGTGWSCLSLSNRPPGCVAASFWKYGRISVLSALEMAELPDRSGVGPQWHISITRDGRRPSESDVRKALRSFRMVGAEEDNHQPGNARHFWVPCDPVHRVDCECKEDEKTVIEPDGYRWTTPVDDAQCRGCEFEKVLGKPCPIHSGVAVKILEPSCDVEAQP